MKKTKTAIVAWLTLSVGLCASHPVHAASQLTFTDKWADAGAYDPSAQMYYVKTTGSFSASVSLPVNGVDISEADAGTTFTFAIGPSGSPTQIISDTLGDAEKYAPGKKSATFAIMDPASGNPIGSATVSWTATTISVTASVPTSTNEDILGEEQTLASQTPGAPTNNALSTTATGVYYEVSVMLDASDDGGGTFNYDNPYVPVTGSDRETEYNPPDGSGPYPLENGSLTGTGNFTPPKLTITSPASGFKVYDANPVVDLAGLASDSEGISNIECIVNGDSSNPITIDQSGDLPTNKLAWTAEVDLSQVGNVGPNLITVLAEDLSGNQTSVSRSYYWIETAAVLVTASPPGAGTVKGLKSSQVLQVGEGSKVTATPSSKNWIFSEWTDGNGDILSSNATFEYVAENNAATNELIANFVSNPFTDAELAVTYTALYYDTNDETVVRDDGYITITVTGTGAFSGKIYNADYGKTMGTLSGQLAESPDGSYATATPPLVLFGKHDYLQVNLQIVTDPVLTDPGAGLMTGYVTSFDNPAATNATDTAEIMGERSSYNSNVLPGPYHIVLQPVSSDPSQGPGGYSYGTATVSKKGTVAVALNLADGASPAISFSSALAQDGSCPIYASLYGGNGVLLGWMQFATDGSGGMSPAGITWFTETYNASLLPNGTAFSGQPLLSGGLYTPPKGGANVFGAGETALTFAIDPGYASLSLPDEIDVPVTYNPAKNIFSYTDNPDKTTIILTPATGALSGSFVYPPGSRNSFSYKGVVTEGAGYGFYKDPANKETGPVWLGVPPAPAVIGSVQK